MAEETQGAEKTSAKETSAEKTASVKLESLYAFKVGMSTVYTEEGASVPVTVLRYDPWVVSQLKSQEKDGYQAVQIACNPRKASRTDSAEKGHLKKAGFENGAQFVRECRQDVPEAAQVGQKVEIESLSKGDWVKVTSRSKGRGFAGVVRRYRFSGGPATHGAGFHRRPGSAGNRTWPGRVMAGKRMPGHMGDENVTMRNVQVVDVLPDEGVVLVKGGVPGSRNTLVKLTKEKTKANKQA